jgi:hypothetical protein
MYTLLRAFPHVGCATGHTGCLARCCALFAAACVYMTVAWEKDLNSPRFMLSGFLSNMNNTLTTVRTNKQVLVFTAITALCESSILIFSFCWAPWMDTIAREASQHLPYEVIFSSMILASMLGNYLFQMFARGSGAVSTPEAALQGLLVVSSGAYLLGAVFQRAGFALLCAVVVQLSVGGYWPCVGYYRGRLLMHEQRNTVIVLSRYYISALFNSYRDPSEPLLMHPTLAPSLQAGHTGDHRHGAEHSAPLAPAGGVRRADRGRRLPAGHLCKSCPVLHLCCTVYSGVLPRRMAGILCAMSCYCRWTPS